jgi:PAS domain-containing protein
LFRGNIGTKIIKMNNSDLSGSEFSLFDNLMEGCQIISFEKCCMEERVPDRIENEFSYPDGSVLWFLPTIQPTDEEVLIMSFDITKSRLAEKTLIESEKKFKSVFESSNVAKSITRFSGEINVNQAFCDMLGYSMGELREIFRSGSVCLR